MYVKVKFEDGYMIDKYYPESVSIVIDDLQINKHGPIIYVMIDN